MINTGRRIPTGFNRSAQRCRAERLRWVAIQTHLNPAGVASIPEIPFVKFDFVSAQQLPELILKRNFAMMFFLSSDVNAHQFNLRKANREYPLAVLPRKIREVA